MWEAENNGWFWGASCSMESPLGAMVMGYYDATGTWRTDELTPYGLHEGGYVDPNPTGVWVPKYDTTNNIYNVCYATYLPLPFQKKYRLSIKAPPVLPLTVRTYTHLIAEIINQSEFNASLREVFGSSELSSLLKTKIALEAQPTETKTTPRIAKIVKEVLEGAGK
jgi:hypothetical protein